MYLGLRRGSRLLTVGICILSVFVLSATVAYLSKQGMDLERSFVSAAAYSSANDSVYGRQNLVRDAWHEYLDHPWLGSSIVEKKSLFYPHNAIVEAFMATGTFGGAAFSLLALIAIYRAFRLTRAEPCDGLDPTLFLSVSDWGHVLRRALQQSADLGNDGDHAWSRSCLRLRVLAASRLSANPENKIVQGSLFMT